MDRDLRNAALAEEMPVNMLANNRERVDDCTL